LGDTATREQHVRAEVAELDRQEESAARGPEASLQRVAPMGDPALYTMTFGKYRKRKLTVAQVHAENPGYLTHIVASMGNSISSFPGFRQALMDAGLWLSIVRDTPGVRLAEANRVMERKASTAATGAKNPRGRGGGNDKRPRGSRPRRGKRPCRGRGAYGPHRAQRARADTEQEFFGHADGEDLFGVRE
jgi:hypothetical protein